MLSTPLVALLALWIGSADAASLPTDDTVPTAIPEVEDPAPRRGLFPPRRAKAPIAEEEPQTVTADVARAADAPGEAQAVDPDAPDADAPAEDPPEAGIWDWVGRMDGEIPSQELVEAIEELSETELSERALIDTLSGAEPPVRFYREPKAALAVDPLHLDRVDPSEFDIPIVVNDEVAMWIKYFTGPGRKYYTRWLGRSTRYRPMMYRELEKAGLPRDLVYLSMIESGYNAHAYSHADAAGLWQFIPSTAKLYKMRVDWWVDERRDPERSVEAAIDFLSELHQMFGDWQLAWAAYNGGPGRIRRAVSKSGTKDFWEIARGPYLHPETDNYVPKIMAAAIIGHHPERYGFTDIDYQDELVYETARVEGSIELAVLAKCAGTDIDTMKALNPALRRYATPSEGYDVRIPIGTSSRFLTAVAAIPKEQRATVARHTVSRGETLSSIAGRYGVSVTDLTRANNLKNANRIYVGMTLVVPKHGMPTDGVASASAPRSSTKSAPAPTTTYTVKSGDTLSSIASKYGTTVSAIQSKNGLKGATIYTGQKLTISGSNAATATASGGSSSSAPSTYTVKKGDSLSSIASRHGVKTSDLQAWNGISNASQIQVGQVLKLKGGSTASGGSQWKTYSVRAGDSLTAIASRNSCSVDDLREWNRLSGSTIHPGQELRIRVN